MRLQQFVKYHSLGNDFILLDWRNRSHEWISKLIGNSRWSSYVMQWCDRHRGIGADGLLILTKNRQDNYEMLIFNADGSSAKICLNGIRCCAHYLYVQYPGQEVFHIQSGNQLICNQIQRSQKSVQIITHISFARYQQKMTLSIQGEDIHGHSIDVGNPHFVVLQKKEISWLSQYGSFIEKHPFFPRKTNVEFVWREKAEETSRFRVIVYERGCGMTAACSSGGAAIIATLHRLKMIKKEECIHLHMQGGVLQCTISKKGDILLIGDAHPVFSGDSQMHLQ